MWRSTGIIFAIGCSVPPILANPVVRNNKPSSSIPWPEIPQQDVYQVPSGSVYVYPTSVVRGVTSNSSPKSGNKAMVFNNVGDTYTRKEDSYGLLKAKS